MEERYKSKIIVDLFLERENEKGSKEILLLLRQNTGHADGLYDLPGGHVDPNEDIFDAMIREAKEEIGIDILRKNMKIVHIFHHFEKDSLKFVFSVGDYSGKIDNKEPDKCKELKWVDVNNVPDNIILTIKDEIECIKNKVYYSSDTEKININN